MSLNKYLEEINNLWNYYEDGETLTNIIYKIKHGWKKILKIIVWIKKCKIKLQKFQLYVESGSIPDTLQIISM